MRFPVKEMTLSAIVAALYAAVTLILAPISFGVLQFRISEVLCILPFFFPVTAWGLFIGCAVSNLIGGFGVLDIVFGSLATLIAAQLTAHTRRRFLACLPPVLINAAIVGAILAYTLTPDNFFAGFAANALWVGIGEGAVMFGLGLPLLYFLPGWDFFRKLIIRYEGRTL